MQHERWEVMLLGPEAEITCVVNSNTADPRPINDGGLMSRLKGLLSLCLPMMRLFLTTTLLMSALAPAAMAEDQPFGTQVQLDSVRFRPAAGCRHSFRPVATVRCASSISEIPEHCTAH
jgi:hypothetical protein